MTFLSVDRELNYGRAQLDDLFQGFSQVRSALDVGVGTGDDLIRLHAQHPGARLMGVDFNPANLGRVSERGIEPLCVNIERERIPVDDESVDVVIANQVFEHLKEVFWCLHECCRILAPGGQLVVGVPNLASFHNRLLLLAGRQPTCIRTVGPHVRGFTKRDMLELVQSVSGGALEMQSFAGANFYPMPAVLAKPLASLLPNAAVTIFLSFREVGPYRAEFMERVKREPFETNYFVGQHIQTPA